MVEAKFLKPDTLALHAGQHPDRRRPQRIARGLRKLQCFPHQPYRI